MVAREEPRTADIELLGKLVTALSMGARATDDPKDRLRFACARLLEIGTEEFTGYLQPAWKRVLEGLIRYGPDFDRMTEREASVLMGRIVFAMGSVERLAGL